MHRQASIPTNVNIICLIAGLMIVLQLTATSMYIKHMRYIILVSISLTFKVCHSTIVTQKHAFVDSRHYRTHRLKPFTYTQAPYFLWYVQTLLGILLRFNISGRNGLPNCDRISTSLLWST